jgi:hypothetical protein
LGKTDLFINAPALDEKHNEIFFNSSPKVKALENADVTKGHSTKPNKSTSDAGSS